MKIINTGSKGYKFVRKGVSWISGIGAVVAAESVIIPFVELVWNGHPVAKLLGRWGAVMIATGTGVVSMGVGSCVTDGTAQIYNSIADKINEKKERKKVEFKTEVNRPDKDILNDLVEETKMFEFDSEDDAKSVLMASRGCISAYGYLDLATYYKIIKDKPLPTKGKYLELLQMNGWTSEDIDAWFVEEGADGVWIFGGVTNYHDISSQFKVIKESDLNAIKE